MNQLLNARIDITEEDEWKIFNAIQALIKQETELQIDVHTGLPRWIEERHAKELRELLREPRTQSPIQGAKLGDVGDRLMGAWQFFYVSPTNEQGALKPQIRGFAILFCPADESSMQVLAISGRRRWSGLAYLLASHIYIVCADDVRRAAEVFVINIPTAHHEIVVGSGAGLELFVDKPHITPGVIGFFCFGQKWAPSEGTSSSSLKQALERVFERNEIGDADLAQVRAAFCGGYPTIEQFRKKHLALFRYVESHKINGETALQRLQALHVAYP